jgi:hypothetical protein
MMGIVAGSNVVTNQLSDISPDMGLITNGILGPATIINTTQDYFLFSYPYAIPPISPLEVVGPNIELIENATGEVLPGILDITTYARYITVKVHKPGLYQAMVSYTVNLAGDTNHGYSGWTITYWSTIQAGTEASLIIDKGKVNNGELVWFEDPGTLSYAGVAHPYVNAYTHAAQFYLAAEDEIKVSVQPRIETMDVQPPGTYPDDPWHNMVIEAYNLSVVRLSGL